MSLPVTVSPVQRTMSRLTIAQRLALLAAAVALIMTIAICLLSFLKGRAVLTEHEVVNLSDECNLRMFEIREEFRYISREVRDSAGTLPKPAEGRSLADHVAGAEFDAAWHASFTRLIAWAERHAKHSPWSWVDRDIVSEAYFLSVDADGSSRLLKGLRRIDDRAAEFNPATDAPQAAAALADIQAQVKSAAKQKSAQARQYTSPLRPMRTDPQRRALCIAYEILGGTQAGLMVVAIDFTRMVANEARHSPRHLFFVTDRDGVFLVHPDAAKVGVRTRDDLDDDQKPRFDFHQGPLAGDSTPATELEQSQGETLTSVDLGKGAHYFFSRKAYPRNFPFRDETVRQALTKDLDALAERDPRFRFSRPQPASHDMALSTPDPQTLKDAQQLIERYEKEAGYKGGPSWEGPVECSTFAAHVVPFRVGIERSGPEEGGETLHLIAAASLEEIAHDISEATRWVWWVSLAMSVVAAWLALIPATLLTRPLARITRAAQRMAEGDYTADLPAKASGEIGDLARSFRHMAEQIRQRDLALRDTLARMQAVLRTAADGIITFNERGIIEEWNQAAERIFGYGAEEIKGQKVQKLMEIPHELSRPAGEDAAGETVRALSKVISTPSMIQKGRRRDGSTFFLEVAFSEVPLGDRRLVTGIFRDVTKRVEDEERIRNMNELLEARVRLRTTELQEAKGKLEVALQAAQAANQAKDVFVRTISHELRTPLSAVKGFTELLLNPKATRLRENPVPTLQKIHSASEYLLTLINDLLDVARYTAGEQIHLNISEFDLAAFFAGIVEMTNPLVKKNANHLTAEAAANLGRMRADETRVRQILLNLLSNASKFTEQGEITFKAVREHAPGGDSVVFTVADTGTGMTTEQMKDLFKPFYRVDNSITRKHGGTGLGLSISKLLSERMGGAIAVQSEPGKGTTFTVRLPAIVSEDAASSSKPAPAKPAEPGAAPLKKNTVLVIDDDSNSREMVQSFLSREGFRVFLASNGEDGMRLAREVRPSAITLDVMMPGFDGWAVLAALKSDPQTRDIPVVMLTVADDRTRGYTLGASEYVTKPIDWNRLGEILRRFSAEPGLILVVEDDAMQREGMRESLALAGWSVREAANGREALQQLDAEPPAVILLDLMMPEMDGFEFLDELRRRSGGDAIPVIVVTAKDLDDEERRRLSGSVAQVLHKQSMSRDELLARILNEVRGHIPCSAAAPQENARG